jgi:hypothetical protein
MTFELANFEIRRGKISFRLHDLERNTLDDDDIFEGPASCMFSTLIQISDARTSALTSLTNIRCTYLGIHIVY